MAKKTSVKYRDQSVRRADPGEKMPKGKGWRLLHGNGKVVWVSALIGTHNLGNQRIAIFRVN